MPLGTLAVFERVATRTEAPVEFSYGSASLRERLYCDFSDASRPMHGFLIYTASGDSEGTMGGLPLNPSPQTVALNQSSS